MRHHLFADPQPSYKIALLHKPTAFDKSQITQNYVLPLLALDVQPHTLVAMTLENDGKKKAAVSFIKEYLEQLLLGLNDLGVEYLYCTDSDYFKVLTKVSKAEPHHGYVLPCKVKGYEHMRVVLGINHQALIYNPDLQAKLDMGLKTLAAAVQGTHTELGADIIHTAIYGHTTEQVRFILARLHDHPALTCDIEGFSLRFWEAGIGTIAFAWDEHNGVAFPCDYRDLGAQDPDTKAWGGQMRNHAVRRLLLEFFTTYKGELIFHNASYDVKAIIYVLWMQEQLSDTKGMLTGLDIMAARMHDTKVIAYLATNSTAGNVLGLKPLAHEFAGNWAKEEINDITLIPLPELLKYNLVDALSTWFVKKKYFPIMVADKQAQLYHSLMLPSLKLIIQMEMVGMPMSASRIIEVRGQLEAMQAEHLAVINSSPLIQQMNLHVQTKAMVAANAKLKVKQHPLEHFAKLKFNPNSGPQLQVLLYELMGLPVIDFTDTKQPATGAETLAKLINHVQEPAHKALLQALISHGQVDTILTNFIPAFERAVAKAEDGIVWLFGSFNLNGTVSGRLSSSDPNLQNIPAKSIFGKLIKSLFMGPKGWLFCGADFNSLEDMISALTTKDPNKLKVYTDGFDGHALRAVFYFPEELGHIDATDPKAVNVLKKQDHPLRQESKAPTFALTYQGTYHTLMTNLGWPEAKARAVEANYHHLYKVSDEYIQDRLKQANKDGFVEVAFGLRLRTPLISQVMWGKKGMPYEAAAEGRTAGNAMGQSYGLLNNRAAVEFWQRVWKSKYRYDILPCALIHDAIYPLIRDDIEVVTWANRELIACMRWQELPEIQHDTVKLGAALDIFWPDWAHPTTLPNDADQATIFKVCREAKESMT